MRRSAIARFVDFEKRIAAIYKEARRGGLVAVSLNEKLAEQKRMKALETERDKKRRSLFDAQDEIDGKRGELIAQLEAQLTQKATHETLFTVRWRVV